MQPMSDFKRKTVLAVLFFMGIVAFAHTPCAYAKTTVMRIRHWSAPSSTRIVLDMTDKASYSVFSLDNPPRIVVDLQDAVCNRDKQTVAINDEHIRRVRLANRPPNAARLVLDLSNARLTHKTFALAAMDGQPHRLVFDIKNPKKDQQIQKERRSVQRKKSNRTRVVVIDAGHGGMDPGAVGPKGTKEKDVVLAISKKLHNRLSKIRGIKAFLTRDGDYFIELAKRVEIAQQYGADLFISIHADASRNRKVHGASVYCLSLRGATDAAARFLADRENAADQVGGVHLNGDKNLNSILLDLVQTQTINDSLKWGGLVLKEVEGIQKIKFSMPRQAGFRVLKAPDVPSILVETGFISNYTDERRLKSTAFQNKMASALESAVLRFLCSQAQGSPDEMAMGFCSEPERRAHVVESGQNLTQIATLYRTSIGAIRRANNLRNASVIYPGQELMIP